MTQKEFDEITEKIADCEACEQDLTDWERTFIASVSSQWEDREFLTPVQLEKLQQIWETRT